MDLRPINALSLFSGVGGLDLGLAVAVPDIRTVCWVEREAYCCEVLRARMQEGFLDDAPIWTDITTFDGRPWRGVVDIIAGGFPCQDISVAGKGEGIKEGNRSGLWSEFARIIREVQPRYVFVENVSALLIRGIDRVLGDLAEMGFDAVWGSFTAEEVGAPHRRERVFILGHTQSGSACGEFRGGIHAGEEADSQGEEDHNHHHRSGQELADASSLRRQAGQTERRRGQEVGREGEGKQRAFSTRKVLADPDNGGSRQDQQRSELRTEGTEQSPCDSGPADPRETEQVPLWPPGPSDTEGWKRLLEIDPTLEPAIRSDLDGTSPWMADRVDALRAGGNGVVPLQAAVAFGLLSARF